MSQINRVPFGLQDLLGSKNFGTNPSQLGQVVTPTLELWDFLKYERRARVISAGGFATAVTQQIELFVIPDTEIWLVEQVGCTIAKTGAMNVGDQIHLTALAINLPDSDNPGVNHPLADLGSYTAATANPITAISRTYEFASPVVFGPGDAISFFSNAVVAAAGSWSVRSMVRFIRLTI